MINMNTERPYDYGPCLRELLDSDDGGTRFVRNVGGYLLAGTP